MHKVAILYDASQAILSTFELDEVLEQILAIARDYFHLQSGAILLLDKQTGSLMVRSQFGMGDGLNIEIPPGVGLCGAAVQLKRPIYAPDVSKDSRYVSGVPTTRSEIVIPLIVRDEILGVLDGQSSEPNAFNAEEIDLLTLFATQASIGLQNSLLYSLLQRRAAQLEAINAIAKQTTAVLDLPDLLSKTSQHLLQAFPLDHVAVFLRAEQQDSLTLRAQAGSLTTRVALEQSLPEHFERLTQAINIGKAVVYNTVAADSDDRIFQGSHSEIYVPLISFGDEIGVLACGSTRDEGLQTNEIQAIESMADIIATAIQNAGHVEQIRQLAFRDGLTAVFNRRYFESKVLEELERASRYSNPLSLLMIDIDHFKDVNDEFGHLLGDEVLKQVSTIFTTQVRKVDYVCRYGGEEFAIIVPQTPGDKALGIAEKLRRKISTWHFPGVPRSITVSIGVAEFPQHGETRDSLVRAADAALYLAKQKGRNRVQSASLSELAPSNNPE